MGLTLELGLLCGYDMSPVDATWPPIVQNRFRILRVELELLEEMLKGIRRLYTTDAPPDMRIVKVLDRAALPDREGVWTALVASAGFHELKIGDDIPELTVHIASYYDPRELPDPGPGTEGGAGST